VKRTVAYLLATAFAAATAAMAPAGGRGYELPWYTIDGGGHMDSTGGGFSLGGTIGQAEAGTAGGGSFVLTGGFWSTPPCPWDCAAGGDGTVDVVDFLALLAEWGQAGTRCDVDGGGVGITDFLAMLAVWGPCP
jgi:hypothetical protein